LADAAREYGTYPRDNSEDNVHVPHSIDSGSDQVRDEDTSGDFFNYDVLDAGRINERAVSGHQDKLDSCRGGVTNGERCGQLNRVVASESVFA
jgi:hypothetical protein